MGKSIQSFAQRAERIIIHALIFMMAIVLLLATIELAYNIVLSVITPPLFFSWNLRSYWIFSGSSYWYL